MQPKTAPAQRIGATTGTVRSTSCTHPHAVRTHPPARRGGALGVGGDAAATGAGEGETTVGETTSAPASSEEDGLADGSNPASASSCSASGACNGDASAVASACASGVEFAEPIRSVRRGQESDPPRFFFF